MTQTTPRTHFIRDRRTACGRRLTEHLEGRRWLAGSQLVYVSPDAKLVDCVPCKRRIYG